MSKFDDNKFFIIILLSAFIFLMSLFVIIAVCFNCRDNNNNKNKNKKNLIQYEFDIIENDINIQESDI